MLINKNTQVTGVKCILVPYRKEHVLKYHEWMKSPELQELTASEPLSLEEEYGMQKSWQEDYNKLTFIILDKEKFEQTHNEIESMIGDTNLFFANGDDRLCAEAEIMIAEPWARGRHCGSEAILLMFLYSVEQLEVKQFIVKIGDTNPISQQMFQNFGFVEISYSTAFREYTYCKIVDDAWLNKIRNEVKHFVVETNKQIFD